MTSTLRPAQLERHVKLMQHTKQCVLKGTSLQETIDTAGEDISREEARKISEFYQREKIAEEQSGEYEEEFWREAEKRLGKIEV